VLGIVGGELSSSDDRSFGGGDLRPAGSKETGSVIEVGPLRLMLRRRDGDEITSAHHDASAWKAQMLIAGLPFPARNLGICQTYR